MISRRKAAALGLVGAAVFIIPNYQSLGAADSLYFFLLLIGTILAAVSVYASAVWE